MKVKYNQTGQIYDMPDNSQIDPKVFSPIENNQSQQSNTIDNPIDNTDPNAAMRQQYQGIYNANPSLKNKNAIADAFKNATGIDLFGTPAKTETPDETKRRIAKENAERIITTLENKYYGGNLAQGRIGGALGNILGAVGWNPNLVDYKTLRESVKPTLARAAGDVGNLAIQEQEAAIKSIPSEFSTPEEAAKQFASTREKFGLSASKYKKPSLEDLFK